MYSVGIDGTSRHWFSMKWSTAGYPRDALMCSHTEKMELRPGSEALKCHKLRSSVMLGSSCYELRTEG